MNEMLREQVQRYAIRLGDDALILGHRLSEWSARAPFLEEDVALANVALDFIGRARLYYSYGAELAGGDCTEDSYAYTRDCRQFENLLLCELPRGDFACTVMRQYLLDAYDTLFLEQLAYSQDHQLAAIAAKAGKETAYHVRRSRNWLVRLGDGTDESHRRLQSALASLWGYTPELFECDALEQALIAQGIAADRTMLREPWLHTVRSALAEATLELPSATWSVSGGRAGLHTEHLGYLLAELQFLQRAYPGLQW
jgi:ring-1,2-phenylacetyl-CoA epoxidase subunit PaaC